MKFMIRIAIAFCLLIVAQLHAAAQVSDISGLLAEGYTITELESMMKEITYKNYKKWMKGKGYTYTEEMNNGFTQVFNKNDVVTVGLFFSPDDELIKHVMAFSSPQKFYKAQSELEKSGFTKRNLVKIKNANGGISEQITWKKEVNPYAFVSNSNEYYIKICYKSAEKDDLASLTVQAEQPVIKAAVQEIKIGSQTWSSVNYSSSYFANGDLIKEAKTKEEWEAAANNQKAAWCYPLNSADNEKTYGKLYNWYTIKDSRGLAPKGWHIPGRDEVDVLIKYLGGSDVADDKMKTTHTWLKNGTGTNSSGFSAIPAGQRYQAGGFSDFNHGSYIWTKTLDQPGTHAHHFIMQSAATTVMNQHLALLGYGCSVRFVKD